MKQIAYKHFFGTGGKNPVEFVKDKYGNVKVRIYDKIFDKRNLKEIMDIVDLLTKKESKHETIKSAS